MSFGNKKSETPLALAPGAPMSTLFSSRGRETRELPCRSPSRESFYRARHGSGSTDKLRERDAYFSSPGHGPQAGRWPTRVRVGRTRRTCDSPGASRRVSGPSTAEACMQAWRNHGHSCFLCEIVIRSQFHTTYEPEA